MPSIGRIVFCLLTVGIVLGAAHPLHLNSVTKKYPYALLGEDYQILDAADLAISGCIAEPVPFSEKSTSYPYWKCFQTKSVLFECEYNGVQDPKGPIEAWIVFETTSKNERNTYLARRAWYLKDCKKFEARWKELVSNETHVCMLGSLIRVENGPGETKLASWVFEKYRTRKGCESYFDGHCDLKHFVKSDCVGAKR